MKDREAWHATVHRVKESDTSETEQQEKTELKGIVTQAAEDLL